MTLFTKINSHGVTRGQVIHSQGRSRSPE